MRTIIVDNELSRDFLLECYDLVFNSAHSDGFKVAEIKDLITDKDYRFNEMPKKDWSKDLKNKLKTIGVFFDRTKIYTNI